jgi:hypothetical protein
MTRNRLTQLLEEPETHRLILEGYSGPYALGVAKHPDHEGELALRLRVRGLTAADFPEEIVLEGEPVTLLVEPDFVAPRPLKA